MSIDKNRKTQKGLTARTELVEGDQLSWINRLGDALAELGHDRTTRLRTRKQRGEECSFRSLFDLEMAGKGILASYVAAEWLNRCHK